MWSLQGPAKYAKVLVKEPQSVLRVGHWSADGHLESLLWAVVIS